EIEKFDGAPLLATIRSSFEGGNWKGSEEDRLALFKAVLPKVDAVDIEISSLEIRDDVIAAARESGKPAIGSFHDFKGTPPLHVIQAMADEGWKCRATFVKVATHCQDWNDLRTLAEFTLHNVSLGVVSIGMGPAGLCSRVLFPALGSLFTFASFGNGTAPGQMGLEETAGYLRTFYPQSR
ncbi:MAG: type I 3-dehydroquinate dehydratase, partial [Candidatus Hydrogenedentales bacterium]